MLDYVTDFTRKPVPGPYQGSGRSHFIFTKGGSALLGLPGYAMLYSVEVATGGTPGTLTIYNGIDATGDVVAKIDLSQKMSYLYGGLYCAAGMYVEIDTAATVSVAIVYDGANPKVVTTSGNEITDPVRASSLYWATTRSGDMTDGFGYTLVKNLVGNGGFEKDASGWVRLNTGTISRDSTHAQFGLQALKVVCAAAGDGAIFGGGAVGVGGVQTYTFSAYVFSATGGGEMCQLFWDENVAGAYNNTKAGTPTPLALGWTRVVLTATTAASVDTINIYMEMNAAITVWMDGVQVEAGPTANGYVDTNGIVATGLVGSGDQSYGIFRAATNLFQHGQCDSLSTPGWTTSTTGSTPSVDATVAAPFASQSIKYVFDGTLASQSIQARSAVGLAAATGVMGVGSIYFKGVNGAAYTAACRWTHTDSTTIDGTLTSFTATGGWQLISPAAVAVGSARTGDYVSVLVRVPGGSTRAETVWAAHAMLESGQGVVAPYVATSGGATATHAAGRVQAPPSLLNGAQSWVAVRVRFGMDPTAAGFTVGDGPTVLTFGDTGNESFRLYYRAADASWRTRAAHLGSSTGDAVVVAAGSVSGTLATAVGYWTGTQVATSVNGSVFTKTTPSAMPVMGSPTLDLGTAFGASGWFGGDLLWVAGGTGTLTDADAATINGFGSTCPNFHSFPDAAQTAFIWPCVSTDYLTPF